MRINENKSRCSSSLHFPHFLPDSSHFSLNFLKIVFVSNATYFLLLMLGHSSQQYKTAYKITDLYNHLDTILQRPDDGVSDAR